jgi:hypothetical protein
MLRVAFIVLLASLLGGCYNEAAEFRKLVQSSEVANATVVYVDCSNHGAVYYSLSVAGREFRAKAANGELNCGALKRGDVVKVYYDPQRPQVNTVLRPTEAYERARGWYLPEWLFIMVPLFGLVAFPVMQAIYAERRKSARRGA